MSHVDFTNARKQFIAGKLGTEAYLIILNTVFEGNDISDQLQADSTLRIARKHAAPKRRKSSRVRVTTISRPFYGPGF